MSFFVTLLVSPLGFEGQSETKIIKSTEKVWIIQGKGLPLQSILKLRCVNKAVM